MKEESETKVLVVEDNSFSWEFLKAALQGLGLGSEVARDGLEAVQKLEEKRYELVFMDCQLPNMDGYEATRRIRSMKGNNITVPIIAISATVTAQIQDRCLRCGMNGLLQKPVDTDYLKQLVDRYMPNQRGVINYKNTVDVDREINFKDAVSLLCKEMRITMAEASSLMQDFFRISRQLFLNIENASISGNQADIARYAHQIKGMASIMRLRRIQSAAERLEKGTGQLTCEVNQLKKLLIEYRI